MSVIFLLIPLSVLMAIGFLGAFIWAVRSGQYEDTYTPSLRLLGHDGPPGRQPELPPSTQPRNTSSAPSLPASAPAARPEALPQHGTGERRAEIPARGPTESARA